MHFFYPLTSSGLAYFNIFNVGFILRPDYWKFSVPKYSVNTRLFTGTGKLKILEEFTSAEQYFPA